MNLFEKTFRALNKAKIKYLVVGGVAVNLYGHIRFTEDLDLLLLLEEENLKNMEKAKRKFVAKKMSIDIDLLKHWKSISTKAKLDWLEDAMKFGKFKKF